MDGADWSFLILQDSLIASSWLSSARSLSKATTSEEKLQALEQEVGRLTLLTQAIWELAKGKLEISEADLLKKVKEIDLRDGTLNGRPASSGRPCPHCGRMIAGRSTKCLYCGQVVVHDSAFEEI